MATAKTINVALLWAQFGAYHVDRCEAVAERLAGRAQVLAVEVASTSRDYAWERSGHVSGASKITLFPEQSYDSVPPLRRLRAMLGVLRHCDLVCIGLSYGETATILLSWILRLLGVRVVAFSESKFDDSPRSLRKELSKAALLSCYFAAIVGARRHIDYFRFLGFRRRTVLPGYDCVGLERVRAQGGGQLAPGGTAFEARPFLFVGRFVPKKNLLCLIDAYAHYVALAGAKARRLVLVGSGPEEPRVRERIAAYGLGELIDLPGFLTAPEVSRMLAGSLALMLISFEEQWGLVVNEALAFGLPVIVSTEVGSRDALVRNMVNGYVVESGSSQSVAQAMFALAADRENWERLVAGSHARAWLGDTGRLADAIELLIDPGCETARARVNDFLAELEHPS